LYELKQHKSWFDKEFLHFDIKGMQRLQNPNQRNENNLQNVRRGASKHFKEKHLKAKIDKL
jgi:hypothetical protein